MKKLIQNIPGVGKIITVIYRYIRYKLFRAAVNPMIEIYFQMIYVFKKSSGITKNKRDVQLVVNLTTFDKRINRTYLAIASLLNQSLKPDRVILWLSDEYNIIQSGKSIPENLKKLIKRGLTIRYIRDVGSYSKYIYALKFYPNFIHVTADDDLFYNRNWLKDLYNSFKEDSSIIYCHVARAIKKSVDGKLAPYNEWKAHYDHFKGPSFNIFPYTGHGCLIPPNAILLEIFNEKMFQLLAPKHDDAWLQGMAVLSGIRLKRVRNNSRLLHSVRGTQDEQLWHYNMEHGNQQVKAIYDHYNLYKFLESDVTN